MEPAEYTVGMGSLFGALASIGQMQRLDVERESASVVCSALTQWGSVFVLRTSTYLALPVILTHGQCPGNVMWLYRYGAPGSSCSEPLDAPSSKPHVETLIVARAVRPG